MTNVLSNLQKAGYGLMNFTWVASRKFTQEQFNKALTKVVDNSGASVESPLFLNGGEFYGIPNRHEGLQLLGDYFKTHPEHADKVYVSIKAGTTAQWGPDTSTKNLTSAVETINKYLTPLYEARTKHPKTLDMFTVARVGKEPIEDVVNDLVGFKDAGKLSAICLSEVSASTLQRAVKTAKIDAIEVEFSLFHREGAQNGLFPVCIEHDIPVVCYSPLGKGLLVGQKPTDLAKDDMRNNFDKFNDPSVFKHNEVLVSKVQSIAESSKLTPAQVALSWITNLSGTTRAGVQYPYLLPIPGSTNADRQLNNLDVVKLPEDVLAEIDEALDSFKTAGHRYNKMLDSFGYK